ncbi:hypothetical protein ACFYXQ_44960 [Nocardia jiangxiensis]|uniref:Uncharacterized protein n=1 Tax=Nocardia jiangxiensis TaxID=282685 RepID=A0ABW6SH02_9NOCA
MVVPADEAVLLRVQEGHPGRQRGPQRAQTIAVEQILAVDQSVIDHRDRFVVDGYRSIDRISLCGSLCQAFRCPPAHPCHTGRENPMVEFAHHLVSPIADESAVRRGDQYDLDGFRHEDITPVRCGQSGEQLFQVHAQPPRRAALERLVTEDQTECTGGTDQQGIHSILALLMPVPDQ